MYRWCHLGAWYSLFNQNLSKFCLNWKQSLSHNIFHRCEVGDIWQRADLPIVSHDDVIKWKHFPRYQLFREGNHRSPVYSPHTGRWRGALILSLICAWTNGWANIQDAGDLRCNRAQYANTLMPKASRDNPYKTDTQSYVTWMLCLIYPGELKKRSPGTH